jgi:hypothetical protein
MTVEPRSALEQLIVALERHLEAAQSSRNPDHPMVMAAAQDLAEAFDDYDEALYTATDVATPLAIFGEEFEEDDDEQAVVEAPAAVEDGGVYAGLDTGDYDEDDDDDEDDDEDDDDEDLDDDEDDDDLDDDLDDEDDEDDDDDDLDDEDDDEDDGESAPANRI